LQHSRLSKNNKRKNKKMLAESPIPGKTVLNRRINKLWERCPEEFREVVQYWLLAKYNGYPCYPKPLSLNYIRINLSAFINHLLRQRLRTDLSNIIKVTLKAIERCPRSSFSTRHSILEAAKSFLKAMSYREQVSE
jgi:hypothetical protein